MEAFLEILMVSGKKGFELAFFVLMPVMVLMMSVMRLLDRKGGLRLIAIVTAPFLSIFGIPGLGVFAIFQILLVSFAAPVSTLRIMDMDGKISDRKISATLAAVLAMSQANTTFPLMVFGLDLPFVMLTSLLGGLTAGLLTFRFFASHLPDGAEANPVDGIKKEEKQKAIKIILEGAEEGFQLVLKAVPIFVMAVFIVNLLREAEAVKLLENLTGPLFSIAGLSGAAVLPIVTKYIAGGTAMMGATIQLLQENAISATDLNKIAGFTINPLDPVGVAVILSAGKRVTDSVVPAIKGAAVAILFRGILHMIWF